MIGPGWLAALDRLGEDHDWVRIEIAAALSRGSDVAVIPVLVNNARMPGEAALPDDLATLPRRNGIDIPHAHFNAVVRDRLVSALRPLLTSSDPYALLEAYTEKMSKMDAAPALDFDKMSPEARQAAMDRITSSSEDFAKLVGTGPLTDTSPPLSGLTTGPRRKK